MNVQIDKVTNLLFIGNIHEWFFQKVKLNPLQAKWPMERLLIFSFCSVKRMRVFDSPSMGH